MDEISTRAIIIGVAIFVTMFITTVVILEFTHIREIYKNVGETDVSLESKLDELNKYKDSINEFNGLDVRNTVEKYKNNKTIEVCINNGGGYICSDINISESQYTDIYTSELISISKGIRILFSKK
ncbi:MAG: hypothetical protein PHR25_02630 [Clostridia bacterium]|nr:hypothetical protein [Clostridia bacterium]MDD4375655.1 hypothetical protein [Clostridia bacterium]